MKFEQIINGKKIAAVFGTVKNVVVQHYEKPGGPPAMRFAVHFEDATEADKMARVFGGTIGYMGRMVVIKGPISIKVKP